VAPDLPMISEQATFRALFSLSKSFREMESIGVFSVILQIYKKAPTFTNIYSMRYLSNWNKMFENSQENFLVDLISSFVDLSDDGYQIEFITMWGNTCTYVDYKDKNNRWKLFYDKFTSQSHKSIGVKIKPLENSYISFTKLVDVMIPVIEDLDSINWKFVRFTQKSYSGPSFQDCLYTFEHTAETERTKLTNDKIEEVFDYKGLEATEISQHELENEYEFYEIEIESKSYDGQFPDNITSILDDICKILGFVDYTIKRRSQYNLLVDFYI
jgi:hypothetical protein